MTEAQWRSSSDPQAMLRFLRGNASDRKLRLFACACCRRIWSEIQDERYRACVEVAERFAEGECESAKLAAAWDEVEAYRQRNLSWRGCFRPVERDDYSLFDDERSAHTAAANTANTFNAAFLVAHDIVRDVIVAAIYRDVEDPLIDTNFHEEHYTVPAQEVGRKEAEQQADLLREMLNPFCASPADRWRRDATVSSMANSIYVEEAFDRLPILADALEEAGCTSAALLNHCRASDSHLRGCWAVDLVLGKE
jgi:hypothetical protein